MIAKACKKSSALILALSLIFGVASIPAKSFAKNNPVYPAYQVPPGTLYGGGSVGDADSKVGDQFLFAPSKENSDRNVKWTDKRFTHKNSARLHGWFFDGFVRTVFLRMGITILGSPSNK